MKKAVSLFVLLAAFVFAPSAFAKTRVVSIEARGTAVEKAGFFAVYDMSTGQPRAAINSAKNALKNARADAKAQCDELGGRLRETISSRSAGATYVQIGAKEYEGNAEFTIDCVIRELAEEPAVYERRELKPGEVMIKGEIYVKKPATVSQAQ